MGRECYLRQCVVEIQRQFQAACKPYLDELLRIEAMKPPRPMVFNISDIDPATLKQLKEQPSL